MGRPRGPDPSHRGVSIPLILTTHWHFAIFRFDPLVLPSSRKSSLVALSLQNRIVSATICSARRTHIDLVFSSLPMSENRPIQTNAAFKRSRVFIFYELMPFITMKN